VHADDIPSAHLSGVGLPFHDGDEVDHAEFASEAAAANRASPNQGAPSMVPARFRIPDGFAQIPLWWSAVPLDPGMSPEAWAPIAEMIEAEGEFEPGRYEVSALAPGEVAFKGIVEILPGQANVFVIALDDAQSYHDDADGFFEPAVVVCTDQPAGCPYLDPQTRLDLVIPDGWSMTQPFVYETAAGVAASVASATLFRAHDSDMLVIELNPRQWSAMRGACLEAGVHRICHGEADLAEVRAAVATVARSLDQAKP